MKQDSVIIYTTPDHKQTLITQKSALPDRDTPEMKRFMELAIAVMERGYKGISPDPIRLPSGGYMITFKFNIDTIEGFLLKEMAENAMAGMMPPSNAYFLKHLSKMGAQL